jgi:hypothetical protein
VVTPKRKRRSPPLEQGAPAARDAQAGYQAGWDAALREIEHQAVHWDTPEHGDTGHLIAEALRVAASIGRGGGLQCEHRTRAGAD